MNHWYDNTISQGILKEKYYHKGEKTPQEFMDRVSSIFDPELKKRVRGYLEVHLSTKIGHETKKIRHKN